MKQIMHVILILLNPNYQLITMVDLAVYYSLMVKIQSINIFYNQPSVILF